MIRRTLIRALTALSASLALASPALADNYPSRPITLVVPWGAGVARMPRPVSSGLCWKKNWVSPSTW